MQSSVHTNNHTGLNKFFRSRLLNSTSDQIAALVDGMEKDAKDIKAQSLKLAWYMRGGITYEQVLQLSPAERDMISELAKDNMETTKKSLSVNQIMLIFQFLLTRLQKKLENCFVTIIPIYIKLI